MKQLIEQFGTSIIAGIICILMIFTGINAYVDTAKKAQSTTNPDRVEVDTARTKEEIKEQEDKINAIKKPTIIARSANIDKGSVFNIVDYVDAYSPNGADISSQVKIVNISPSTGNKATTEGQYIFDTSKTGVYTLKYMIIYNGVSVYTEASYIID